MNKSERLLHFNLYVNTILLLLNILAFLNLSFSEGSEDEIVPVLFVLVLIVVGGLFYNITVWTMHRSNRKLKTFSDVKIAFGWISWSGYLLLVLAYGGGSAGFIIVLIREGRRLTKSYDFNTQLIMISTFLFFVSSIFNQIYFFVLRRTNREIFKEDILPDFASNTLPVHQK